MKRKSLIIWIVVGVLVLLLAAEIVAVKSGWFNKSVQTDLQGSSTQMTSTLQELTGTPSGTTQEASTATQPVSTAVSEDNILKSEEIIPDNNTQEYDMQLKLVENKDLKTFLSLQYYLNAATVENEIDEGDLPELSGIFENRENETGSSTAFRIGQAVLDPVQGQIYLLINGDPMGKYTQSSLYRIGLEDMSIQKLFSYPGNYSKMQFNKDFTMLAYSFGDPPMMSVYQEDNLVEVIDAETGEYLVKGSRDDSGDIIGQNSDPELLYDYELESWYTKGILKLRQATRAKDAKNSGITQNEVLYDVEKNLLLNLDGSEWMSAGQAAVAAEAAKGAQGTQGDKASGSAGDKTEVADSASVKVLKSFYQNLNSQQDYKKAMALLDSSFVLKLSLLQQFGATQIVKSDIDAESASVYSDLLRSAKFESIVSESIKDNTSTITYYHNLGLTPDTPVRQLLIARLVKSGNSWKIKSIEDGE